MLGEFERKTKDCILDERICEVKGKQLLYTNDWMRNEMQKEMQTVG
jgi:hypothetical protein